MKGNYGPTRLYIILTYFCYWSSHLCTNFIVFVHIQTLYSYSSLITLVPPIPIARCTEHQLDWPVAKKWQCLCPLAVSATLRWWRGGSSLVVGARYWKPWSPSCHCSPYSWRASTHQCRIQPWQTPGRSPQTRGSAGGLWGALQLHSPA